MSLAGLQGSFGQPIIYIMLPPVLRLMIAEILFRSMVRRGNMHSKLGPFDIPRTYGVHVPSKNRHAPFRAFQRVPPPAMNELCPSSTG